jgi:FkbM family methyltransferase
MAGERLQYRTEPAADGSTHLVWENLDKAGDGGEYWTTTDAGGIHWLFDGKLRIACRPERAFRFYRHGVARRCNRVAARYVFGHDADEQLVPMHAGAQIVNFGANIGEVAITLADAGARVLAIEPDPHVIPLLDANAQGRAIDVAPVAAWNEDANLILHLKPESADSSLFNASDRQSVVPARRIDALVAEKGIDRVHLICGDAEGAEPEVLEGAHETLKITAYVSVCASAERNGERTLEACEAILTGAGFDILHREETGFCMLIAKNRSI